MREIKFRVWDESIPKHEGELDNPTGQYVEWDYVKNSDYLKDGLSGEYPIEQYTGLKDKNDKEIYEGDILEYKRSSRLLRDTVRFSNGAFWCGFHDGSSTKKRIKLLQPNRVEIIGNIHENH